MFIGIDDADILHGVVALCGFFPSPLSRTQTLPENTMDIVYISDLKVDTVIGIFDWERRIRQTVSLDLEMAADISKGAATDHIDAALDYKAIGKRVIAFIEASEFQLVETLAERVAALVRDEFNVPWLKLRLSKPGALRGSRDVGVIIERGVRPNA